MCNQLGGIYTVLRSKVPSTVARWGNRYCLVGPYSHHNAQFEFEPAPLVGAVGQAVAQLNEMGLRAHYGRETLTYHHHSEFMSTTCGDDVHFADYPQGGGGECPECPECPDGQLDPVDYPAMAALADELLRAFGE